MRVRTDSLDAGGGRVSALLVVSTVAPVLGVLLAWYVGLGALVRLALAGLAAAAAGAVFFVVPRYGVYFVLLYVYAGLGLYLPGGLVPLAVMAAATAGVTVQLARGGRWHLSDPVYLWSVAIFALVALQSMMWAHSVRTSVGSYTKFLKALALVFLAVQAVRTPRDLRTFAAWIFAGAVASVLLGVVNWKLGIENAAATTTGWITRFSGTHPNANFAAELWITAIPMAVFFIKRASTIAVRALAVAGVLVLLSGIFATYSRQAVFALAFVVLAVLFREVRSRRSYAVISTVLVAGILLTPRYYWSRILTISEVLEKAQQDWSLFLRVQAFERAVEMFREHPLFGVGLRNFQVRSADALYVRMPAHNMYLEILCGVGLVGFAAYLSVFYSGIRQCVAGARRRWRRTGPWMRDLAYYLLVALGAAMVGGFFINFEFQYMVWIPLAGSLIVAALRRDDAEDSGDGSAG